MAEMNRDESDRCIQIAQAALEAGNVDKAVRFLEKSLKLCPNTRAKGKKNFRLEMSSSRLFDPPDSYIIKLFVT